MLTSLVIRIPSVSVVGWTTSRQFLYPDLLLRLSRPVQRRYLQQKAMSSSGDNIIMSATSANQKKLVVVLAGPTGVG